MSIQNRSHNHIGVETSSKIGTYPTLLTFDGHIKLFDYMFIRKMCA